MRICAVSARMWRRIFVLLALLVPAQAAAVNSSTTASPTTAVTCGGPPALENGTPTSRTSFPVGAWVTYKCNIGYQFLEGSLPWVTCLENATWTSLQATCTLKSCGSPGEILNGNYNTTGNTFGSIVTFYCDKGYNLVGQAQRLCENNGWSGQVPTCEVVKCVDPPSIKNGKVSSLVDREFWEYGMVASYSCSPGYVLIGAKSITCVETGNWNPASPTCRAVNSSTTSSPTTALNGNTTSAAVISNTTSMTTALNGNTTSATLNGNTTSVAVNSNTTSLTTALNGNTTSAASSSSTTSDSSTTKGGCVETGVGQQYLLLLILIATIYPVFNYD